MLTAVGSRVVVTNKIISRSKVVESRREGHAALKDSLTEAGGGWEEGEE